MTTIKVTGYVYGANAAGGLNFRVHNSSNKDDFRTYLIPHLGYYSEKASRRGTVSYPYPSVEFTVLLQPNTPDSDSSLSRVLRIYECRPRHEMLIKTQLINYFLYEKGCDDDVEQRSIYERMMAPLPKTMSLTSDFTEDKFAGPKSKKWLSQKIADVLAPLFCANQSDLMFLMRYFPAEWLLGFLPLQLSAIRFLLQHKPYCFTFWDTARKILQIIKDPTKPSQPLFSTTQSLLRLQLPRNYISFTHVREDILSPEGTPLSFDPKTPVMSLCKMAYLKEDLNDLASIASPLISRARRKTEAMVGGENVLPSDSDSYPIVHAALSVYLEAEKDYFYKGSTLCDVNWYFTKLKLNPTLKLGTLLFLQYRIRAMVPSCIVEPNGFTQRLLNIERHMEELNFCDALGEKVDTLRLITCNFYNDAYFIKLRDLVNAVGKQNGGNVLLVGANANYASYLQAVLMSKGVHVYSLDAAVEELRKKKLELDRIKQQNAHVKNGKQEIAASAGEMDMERPMVVIVDRVHKLGPTVLLKLLARLQHKCRLVLLGDPAEHPATCYRGGGNIVRDLSALVSPEDWNQHVREKNPDEPTVKLYYNVTWKEIAELDIAPFDPKDAKNCWRKMKAFITEQEKQYPLRKTAGGGGGVLVFCSSDSDKRDLLKGLYDVQSFPYRFSVGDRVHILEHDVWGQVEEVFQYEGGPKGAWLNNKVLDTRHNLYQVKVSGKIYKLNEIVMERAEIVVASRYSGPPVGFGIFFISGEHTNRMDVLGSIKYCPNGMRFYVPKGAEFVRAMEKTVRAPSTDLGNKLSILGK